MAISGIDALLRKLKELEKVVAALDGDIAEVSFDPHDPQSIDRAIQKMEDAIDERVGSNGGNELIRNVVQEAKEKYRAAILDRAATARLSEKGEK